MSIEVKVPVLPESVADATVAVWHKQPGEFVRQDENLVDLETDKVVLEVPAPEDGVLQEILKSDGTIVVAQEILGVIKVGAAAPAAKQEAPAVVETTVSADSSAVADLSPAVRRLVSEHGIDVGKISGSGKGGRITKSDVEGFLKQGSSQAKPAPVSAPGASNMAMGERAEKRVPMTRLRTRVAERLIQAQQTAALLTTFNEVNMQAIMDLRKQYKDEFEKKHGVRLGFMSFFTKAVVEALKQFPAVNSSIDGTDIVYHGYYDIGIAVSTERGLVVPILRNAESMSMAEIEGTIGDCAKRARDGKLALEEMTGGTFTITNGGVFGSLLATPILNPPQTGILGMHKIQQRPMVENGEIVARPMMYLALTYDHRLIDGKESVQFLVAVKDLLEDPQRLLLQV